MLSNITQEYIELTKKDLNNIMKLILENKYQKKLSDEILDEYIKVRYLGFFKEEEKTNHSTLRQKIMKTFQEKELELIRENPEKQKDILNVFVFYYYILYFDGVIISREIAKVIEKIEKLRIKLLGKNKEEFKTLLYNKIKEQEKNRKDFFEKYDTEDFSLKIKNYSNDYNLYKVKVDYNIKFPMIYSSSAIEKAFKTGITNEDKLVIEYYLISANVIKEIIKQNYTKQYIVEFAVSLLKKPKKLKSILNIINNPMIQDKINLKIKYKEFISNKEAVYELLRNGYRIAIILDDSIDVSFTELDKLNAFQYVIVNKKMKKYEEIIKNKIVINNLIEI